MGVAGAVGWKIRRSLQARLSGLTESSEFNGTPPLLEHDPARDRAKVFVGKDERHESAVDSALTKFGGLGKLIGPDDLVLIKISAQWWNQGMTNVAGTRRVIEHILEIPQFKGEVVVFENTHFRLQDGSPLSRAFTRPSERNVDVNGWSHINDLVNHFKMLKAPVSFVGLIDAGPSKLAGDDWHDVGHAHGIYGGDGRGPIADGEVRDGYYWDFEKTFSLRRSPFETVKNPLTWPVFYSPHSGALIDLKAGAFDVKNGARVPRTQKIVWINLSTFNEHSAGGLTGACKSAMGIVDMSCGALGADPRIANYRSVHYFGAPKAMWRMAGPLAHFANEVRSPDLFIALAHWVGLTPKGGLPGDTDARLAEKSAFPTRTVVVSTDPVALDYWGGKHLLMPHQGQLQHLYNVEDPGAVATKFLRYYREVRKRGTLDPALVEVV